MSTPEDPKTQGPAAPDVDQKAPEGLDERLVDYYDRVKRYATDLQKTSNKINQERGKRKAADKAILNKAISDLKELEALRVKLGLENDALMGEAVEEATTTQAEIVSQIATAEAALAATEEIKTPEEATQRLAEAMAQIDKIQDPSARAVVETLLELMQYQMTAAPRSTDVAAAGGTATATGTDAKAAKTVSYPHLNDDAYKITEDERKNPDVKAAKKEARHKKTVDVLWQDKDIQEKLKGKKSFGDRVRRAYASLGRFPMARKVREGLVVEAMGVQTTDEVENQRYDATQYVKSLFKDKSSLTEVDLDTLFGKKRRDMVEGNIIRLATLAKVAQEMVDPQQNVLMAYDEKKLSYEIDEEMYTAFKEVLKPTSNDPEEKKHQQELIDTYLRERLYALRQIFPELKPATDSSAQNAEPTQRTAKKGEKITIGRGQTTDSSGKTETNPKGKKDEGKKVEDDDADVLGALGNL